MTMTDDQAALLRDKYVLWERASREGPMDLRDYNRRAAEALKAALMIVSEHLQAAPAEARSEQAAGEAQRCPVCGYTEEDKRTLMDHHLCPTERGR